MKLVIEYPKTVIETVELPKRFERVWKLDEEDWDMATALDDWLQSFSDYGEVEVLSEKD